MSDIMMGHLPVVRVATNESICDATPEIICKAFNSCNDCPFNDSRKHSAVVLVIERESTDHEKN